MKGLLLSFCLVLNMSQIKAGSGNATGNQQDSTSFYDMSLEDLLKVEVSVAAPKPLTTREIPGIVSVITEEEIKSMGANDLMDVLQTIAGFNFGLDVTGVVGLCVRGNWAQEGKVLLLIDGQQMNEELFATIQLGNHYPVDQISKIEIIRGPGSAMYGGNAAFAVINIITKCNADHTESLVSIGAQASKDGLANQTLSATAGLQRNEFQIHATAFAADGIRSNKDYTDANGSTYNMQENSALRNQFFNLLIKYKQLSIRGIFDNYTTTIQDGFDYSFSKAYATDYRSYYSEIKYPLVVNDKFKITPRIRSKWQYPYKFSEASLDDEYENYYRVNLRNHFDIVCDYNPNKKVSLQSGGEWYSDIAMSKLEGSPFNNGTSKMTIDNIAAFGQLFYSGKLFNLAAGCRVHYSTGFKTSIVPRVGLTKTFNDFHFKILYSTAYRTPSIENLNLGENIKPELSQTTELEAGYKISEQFLITTNVYDINQTNTIVYYYDGMDEKYLNNDLKSGTRGAEVELRLKNQHGFATLNYAYYTTEGKNKIQKYDVPESHMLLGTPSHKLNLTGSIQLFKNLSTNIIYTYMGASYYVTNVDSSGNNIVEDSGEKHLLGFNFQMKELLSKKLDVSLRFSNILNNSVVFIQPYNSLHYPLPGLSRNVSLKLTYRIK